MARIANPDSKRASVNFLEQDFGISFSLDKIYRMMDKLDNQVIKRIKTCALSGAKRIFNTSLDVMFFDCTTLYFESFKEDDLKENGYSKDGKFNQPQVLLALLVTTEGLPVGYEVFSGSTFEGHTLKVIINDLKSQYTVENIVLVADRGLLNKENISCLNENCMHYILGGKLRSLPKKIQAQILQQRDHILSSTEDDLKTWEFEHQGQRWVVSYNEKRAEKDKHDREKVIKKLSKKIVTIQPYFQCYL